MPNERLALLLILLLSALLAVPAKGAVPPVAPPSAVQGLLRSTEPEEPGDEAEAEEEAGEEEPEAEECEAGEEAECEAEEEGGGEECLLAGAQATAAASPHADRLRVSIRYTAFRPAAVAIAYQLRGGALRLGSARAHFGRRGVFHDSVAIPPRELARVLAAHEVTIALHALDTPAYCRRVFEQRLTPKRTGNRLLFS